MRKLRIGFSRNKHDKIASVILQRYLNTDISHTFVIYNTKPHMGDDSIYHSAMGSGVGFVAKHVFEEDNVIVRVYEIDIEEDVYIKIRKELFYNCGRKYGFWQNIGIAIVDFAKQVFGIKIRNPFRKDQNCSELIHRDVISIAFPEIAKQYDPDTISPKDIEDIMKKVGKIINI
jgi:hypothetical protein